jgi:hypothetical protein
MMLDETVGDAIAGFLYIASFCCKNVRPSPTTASLQTAVLL